MGPEGEARLGLVPQGPASSGPGICRFFFPEESRLPCLGLVCRTGRDAPVSDTWLSVSHSAHPQKSGITEFKICSLLKCSPEGVTLKSWPPCPAETNLVPVPGMAGSPGAEKHGAPTAETLPACLREIDQGRRSRWQPAPGLRLDGLKRAGPRTG